MTFATMEKGFSTTREEENMGKDIKRCCDCVYSSVMLGPYGKYLDCWIRQKKLNASACGEGCSDWKKKQDGRRGIE